MDHREYVRSVLRPLRPVPSGLDPELAELSGVKAVVFDVYGTLLISAAGGPGLLEGSAAERAMEKISAEFATGGTRPLLARYREIVRSHQERRRAEGVEYAEVEIRKVWQDLLEGTDVPAEEVERLAIRFECATNPVWPMPNARESLQELRGAEVRLGIISNAQFYTPLVIEALFGVDLAGLGFSRDWSVFSYEMLEGKPSLALFERLRERAAEDGIRAEEILYVGNDFDKDVAPANSVGFRTCLFAGDGTSLRLGARAKKVAAEIADVAVTDLAQIPRLLGLKV